MNTFLKYIACRRIETLLWGYQADRLTPEERQRVASHLVVCPACQTALSQMASTVILVAAFRENASVEPVTGWQVLEARILAEQQSAKRTPVFPLRMRTLILAGGLATLALLCGIFWREAPTQKYVRSNSGATNIARKPDRLPSVSPTSRAESDAPTKKALTELPAIIQNNFLWQELLSADPLITPLTIHEHNNGRRTSREPERSAVKTLAVKTARRVGKKKRSESPVVESKSAAKLAADKTIDKTTDKTKIVLLRVMVAARSKTPKQDFVMPAIRAAADETIPKTYVMDTIGNPSDKSAANITNAGYSGSNGEKRTW